MRRWNGWGDETFTYLLPASATAFLEKAIGKPSPSPDATLEQVMASVPPSRLVPHPLVDAEPVQRVYHARGQSLPDWIAMRGGRMGPFPDGVAYPTTNEHVHELLHYAGRTGTRLIPYGGGSSVVGHVNVIRGDAPVLTVDLGRMNRLLRLDEISQLATFGAGVFGPDLESQLYARGFTLGHFPQSFELSSLGGWIVTRSTGQQSQGYGRIEKLFAGGRMETPLGTWTLPAFPASAAGPDYREVVAGSEGRLGILTEATVRIAPVPEREEFHAAFFPNFAQGLAATREMLQSRVPLSMTRLSTPQETETTLALAGHEQLIALVKRYLALRGIGDERCMLILAATGTMLGVFVPIAGLFTWVTDNYHFMKVMHLLIFAVAGFFGVRVLYEAVMKLAPEGTARSRAFALAFCWLVLYAVVGAQLAWTLKPFLGTPYLPAMPPFRLESGNIYVSFFQSLARLVP